VAVWSPGELRLWDANTGKLRHVFKAHGENAGWHPPPTLVALSPDEQTVAVGGSWDEQAQRWNCSEVVLRDVKTGRVRATFKGHVGKVNSVVFSDDSQSLASGAWESGKQGEVRVWDVKMGHEKRMLRGLAGQVTSVAFSPDKRTVASGWSDGFVRVWDVATRQELYVLKCTHDDWGMLTSVAFSPDGLTLATGLRVHNTETRLLRGEVWLWDVNTRKVKVSLVGHTSWVTSLAFSPDGSTLASSSGAYDKELNRTVPGEVRLWDVTTGKERALFKGHLGRVKSVAFSPDGLTLASGSVVGFSDDALPEEVRLWDVKTGQVRAVLLGEAWPVAFSPDSQTLASGSGKEVRLWDVKTGQLRATLRHAHPVTSLEFSQDETALAAGLEDKTVRLWDLRKGPERLFLRGRSSPVTSVAFSPNGQTLASVSKDQTVQMWDVKSGEQQGAFKLAGEERETYSAVAFSPDGQTLAVGNYSEVQLWDAKAGKKRSTLEGYLGLRAHSVAFSPDGRRVFAWNPEGNVIAWTVHDGQRDKSANPLPQPSATRPHSPDGSLRAEARGDTVVLIDLALEKQDRAERVALEPVRRVNWHTDQAEQAESNADWFAAAFHLGRLLKDRPNDADLKCRRDQALLNLRGAEVAPPPRMEALPRP
jgi:WD40 repeat protein